MNDRALQLAAAQHAYRLALTDALRGAVDPGEAQTFATRVLGDHLGASRVMYGEADPGSAETFTNHREYRLDPAMPTSLGEHRWDEFGAYVATETRAGRTLVVDEVRVHPGTRPTTSRSTTRWGSVPTWPSHSSGRGGSWRTSL